MRNRSRGKRAALVMTGVLIGASLPTAVATTENYLQAARSSQEFFVDGQRVELEAYAIGGHNYVKLRDIGKAVDFSVSYDPLNNAAIIVSGMPYQDEQPTTAPSASAPRPTPSPDYAAQANPAAFTEHLNREVYNGIRDTLLHREEIIAGTYQPIPSARSGGTAPWSRSPLPWANAPSMRSSRTRTDRRCATPGTLKATNQPGNTPRNSSTASLG